MNRHRMEEIGHVSERNPAAHRARVDINTELGDVCDFRKQFKLVDELKMLLESQIDGTPHFSTLWIIVHPFGVQKACYSLFRTDGVALRNEALVQVGLNALEQRIVLNRIQKALGS